MSVITEDQKSALALQIEALEIQVKNENDFGIKLELKDKIHNLKMVLNGVKPAGSIDFECVGCGS